MTKKPEGRSLEKSPAKRLRLGNKYHRRVQEEWASGAKKAAGIVSVEAPCTKPFGRKGRMDIHVDAGGNLTACVELKHSNWDAMKSIAVKRNAQRQISQIWDYIDSDVGRTEDICPGVVFPRQPKDPARKLLIEELFNDRGIQVVWEDEPARSQK